MTWNAAVSHKNGCAKSSGDIKRNCITHLNWKILILRLCPAATADKQNISWSWEGVNYYDTQSMHCLVHLCLHKYTDTNTLPKRQVVDFLINFWITLSRATSETMVRDIRHEIPHFIVKVTYRLLKINGVMLLMQKTATI